MFHKIQKIVAPYLTIIGLGSTVFVSGILGYIFHPVMVRFLSDVDFVHVQFLMSLINILAVVGGISLFVTQEILSFENDAALESAFVNLLLSRFQKAIPWMLGCCVIVAFLLNYAFPITNFWIVFFTTLAIVSGVLGAILMGVIRAKKEYTKINILSVLGAFLKLVLAGGLVWFGRGLWGAIGGVVTSGICIVALTYRYIHRLYRHVSVDQEFAAHVSSDLKAYIGPLCTTSAAVLLITLLTNLDIFLISNILESGDAAVYSSLSLVAKFVFFVCAAIEVYFYNNIVGSKQLGLKGVLKPLVIYLALGVGGIVGIRLLGEWVLDLFKPGLSSSLEFLPMLYIFFLIVGVASLYSKVLIARKQFAILRYMSICVSILAVYMLVRAHDIQSILMGLQYIGGGLLLSTSVAVWRGYRMPTGEKK